MNFAAGNLVQELAPGADVDPVASIVRSQYFSFGGGWPLEVGTSRKLARGC